MSRPRGKLLRLCLRPADLAGAPRADAADCPIARALKRRFPGAVVAVTPGAVWVGSTRYDPPPELGRWLWAWDGGGSPPPRDFFLELSAWGLGCGRAF